jgi:hypothetical protein
LVYVELHLDGEASLTGLALRLHFDASQLVFQATEVIRSSSVGSQTRADVKDLDGDPATGAYQNIGWSRSSGGFPGSGASNLLVRLRFAAVGTPVTTLRLTLIQTPTGYSIDAPSFTIPDDLN